MEQRTSIKSSILQPFLASAANAAAKGQSQFHTPEHWGRVLAGALPRLRPIIADFSCGNGSLLRASSNSDNALLIGSDIDPGPASQVDKIPFDLTLQYPLWKEIGIVFDCIALNPPWDLWWHRDRLAALADSDLPGVVEAFEAHDGRVGEGQIDSTIASLLIALDRMSTRGYAHGMCIANASTIERLIKSTNAPHRAIARHIYAVVHIPGNIMTGTKDSAFESEITTAVLYFSRSHTAGLQRHIHWDGSDPMLPPQSWSDFLRANTVSHNSKHPIANYQLVSRQDTDIAWRAIREEATLRFTDKPRPFNLWLNPNGTIGVHLSLWDDFTGRVDKSLAARLAELDGKRPEQLVIKRSDRDELMKLCSVAHSVASSSASTESIPFRCDPKLQSAVQAAVDTYHKDRTPLYPLPVNLRLGFLDEEDSILCTKSFSRFTAGLRYRLESKSLMVTRRGRRPGLDGTMEDIEYSGQELSFTITNDAGRPRLFMAGHIKSDFVNVDGEKGSEVIHHTLSELTEHFDIPEIPDISITQREEYESRIATLRELEIACAPLKFEPFQLSDYARAACTPGLILAHQQGLGKTLAAYAVPIARFGFTVTTGRNGRPQILPKVPVLIVAPGGLHRGFCSDANKLFHITPIRLSSQAEYLRMSKVEPDGRRSLPPGFYITSYTELGLNGTQRIPETLCPIDDSPIELVVKHYQLNTEAIATNYDRLAFALNNAPNSQVRLRYWRDMTQSDQASEIRKDAERQLAAWLSSVGSNKGPIKCIATPTLGDLCAQSFVAVSADEAVRVQGDHSKIGTAVRALRPQFCLLMTGTPVKNRVPNLFHLAHCATGGHEHATTRFPYPPTAKSEFTETFCVSEENLTMAEKAKGAKGKRRSRYVKYTPQVCNIHQLWKVMAPIMLRRTKKDIGRAMVQKRVHIYRVPFGVAQRRNYEKHLEWSPKTVDNKEATFARLTALRLVAACPSQGTIEVSTDYTPKTTGALELIARFLEEGEQTILFSPFSQPLHFLASRLREAGVRFVILDGDSTPNARAALASKFDVGPAGGIQVALAATVAVCEGFNFPLCTKAITISYPWPLDQVLQSEDRIHRLTSKRDVDVYRMVTEGSIDNRMERQIDEKDDAADLVLDGAVFDDKREEMDPKDFPDLVRADFHSSQIKPVDERELEANWPRLRARLMRAALAWHPASAAVPAPAPAPVPASEPSAALQLPAWLIRKRLERARAAAMAAA